MKKIILLLSAGFIISFSFGGCVNEYDNMSPITEKTKERLKKLNENTD